MSSRTVRLKRVCRINPQPEGWDLLPDEEELTFLPLEAVWSNDLDTSRSRMKSEVATGYTRFMEGDILVPKITPTFQASRSVIAQGLRGPVGCGTTELHVLRPGPDLDTRFVFYLTHSRPFLHGGAAHMYGVAGQKRVPGGFIGDFEVHLPPLDEQRAIVDFLDREIVRIDEVSHQRRALQRQLRYRDQLLLEGSLVRRGVELPPHLDLHSIALPRGWRSMRLAQVLVQLTNGYVGPTRDILLDEGVRYIQSLHIRDGKINFDKKPYFVSAGWHAEHPRTALRSGDILIVQTGQVGQVARVRRDFGEANCHALLIARCNQRFIKPEYLELYLRCHYGQATLLRETTGALHPHLEAGIVRDIRIAVPPLREQQRIVLEVQEGLARTAQLQGKLGQQLALLDERRQTLITAAMTGELHAQAAV